MHQIEVDDEIFSLVKAHAEPLIDTFNSALRRLLTLGGTDTKYTSVVRRAISTPINSSPPCPSLPKHTPQALRQILEVTTLVRGGSYTRTAATQFVAKQHHVFQQTVLDKYCRQLHLTANQFDQLLEQDGLLDLRKILSLKFSKHAKVIEGALKLCGATSPK